MASFSGLFDDVFSDGPYVTLVNKYPIRRRINILLRGSRTGSRKTKELLDSLIGAAAGGTAADTYKRVDGFDLDPGDALQLGGSRAIETRTIINRATTAADVTALKNMVNEDSQPATYPTDASLNGGGGKEGRF